MSCKTMKSRRATTGLFKSVALAALLEITMLVTSAGALTESAIVGTVRSSAGSGTLAGVTVSVNMQGWTAEATTDVSGQYKIDNVPPGTYTVTFSLADRQTLIVTNVPVGSDNKTYLSPELVYIGEGVESERTVAYEAPALQRDRTNSIDVISSKEIEILPERTVEDMIGTEPGVVEVRRKYEGQNEPDLDIRGARPYSNDFLLNGLSFKDPMTGLFTATVSPHAIGQIDFVPGGFPVEYGDANGGLINILSKSGGDRYSGMVEAVTDNGIGSGYDRNWYSAYLSGPVPGVKGATFFGEAERRWLGDRDPSWLWDDVLPNNSLSGWSYHGRVDYRFVEKALLTVTTDYSRNDWQEYRHYYNNPVYADQIEHTPRFRDTNFGLSARLTHELTPNTTYSLMGGYFQNERIMGDGVLFDDLEAYRREIVNPGYDEFYLFIEGDSVLASELDSTIAPGSAGDTLVYAASYYSEFMRYKTSYVTASGSISQDFGPDNRLTLGARVRRYSVRSYHSLNATTPYDAARVDRYGYDSLGNEIDGGWQNGVKHPIYLSFYAKDRIEKSYAIIDLGVRVDRFDYDALVFRNPHNPFNPDGGTDMELSESDLKKAEAQWRVSPQLAVAVPVVDWLQIHGNAGSRYEPPPFAYLYNGWEFVAARLLSGADYSFGRGDLKPSRMVQAELGLDVALLDELSIGATGFYRKYRDQLIIRLASGVPSYSTVFNRDTSLSRGIEAHVRIKPSRAVKLYASFTISKAKSTVPIRYDPYLYYWDEGTYDEPLSWDQRRKFVGLVDIDFHRGEGPVVWQKHPFENVRFNLLVMAGSGLPYTPGWTWEEFGYILHQSATAGVNSRNMPWTLTVDLKLEKDIEVGAYKITPFIWVKNLFDRKNVQRVYGSTGEPNTTGYLDTPEGEDRASDPDTGAEFVSRYLFAVDNPQNYGAPREIYFGLRASF